MLPNIVYLQKIRHDSLGIYNHICDFRLMEQVHLGKSSSLEVLFNRYYEPLYNFAFLFLRSPAQQKVLFQIYLSESGENGIRQVRLLM
jgi:hypothetical protein